MSDETMTPQEGSGELTMSDATSAIEGMLSASEDSNEQPEAVEEQVEQVEEVEETEEEVEYEAEEVEEAEEKLAAGPTDEELKGHCLRSCCFMHLLRQVLAAPPKTK